MAEKIEKVARETHGALFHIDPLPFDTMMIAALLLDSVNLAHVVLEGYFVMVQIENGA